MRRWPEVPIRRVATLGTGHTPSRQHPEYWVNCTIPWLTLADVGKLRDGTVMVVNETEEKISLLGVANSSAVVHPAGTVALSRTASVGFTCILGVPMATSQDFATWACGGQLYPRFLLHALRGNIGQIRERMTGSTHKTIYMPDIETLTVPLPPSLTQQRAIADYLDAQTAGIDALIAKKHRIVELLDERRGRALSSVTSCTVDQGLDLKAQLGWQPLRHVAQVRGGVTLGKSYDGPAVTVPYLRVANVQDGYLDLDDLATLDLPLDVVRRHTLVDGDLLLLEGNGNPANLGRGTMWRGEADPCVHQNHVHVVRADRSRVLPEYLALVARSEWARFWFSGGGSDAVGISTLSQDRIRQLRIPVPTLAEQAVVTQRVAQLLRIAAPVYGANLRQIELLIERRQALITAAVTGQLRIPGLAA